MSEHRINRGSGSTRRTFLKHVAVAGATLPVVMPRLARANSANGRLQIAGVGCGGKGGSDLANISEGQQVIALCDVDRNTLNAARDRYEGAETYTDFREMFDSRDDIDACNVSSPDHMHAIQTMWAMNHGVHCYTQKPLTRTIHEARALARVAEQKNIITQMGQQNHSGIGYRMTVDLLQRGVIGKITEAHAWSDRPIWPQPVTRPDRSDDVPAHLDWNLWLGVAEERPYVDGLYHPFSWRAWMDFGTGAIGDMAVHILDPVVWGLDLAAPLRVQHRGPASTSESYPAESVVRYQFAGTPYTAGDRISVTWYDGGNQPDRSLVRGMMDEDQSFPGNGSLYIGEEGALLVSHGGGPQLLPRDRFREVDRGEHEPRNHYHQFRDAVRGEDKTSSHFGYAALLTEVCLVGAIATHYPDQTLRWDAEAMEFTDHADATAMVKPTYRSGWEVEGI